MLTNYNPFITVYKTARERLTDQQANFRILLNPQIQLIIESGANYYYKNLLINNEVIALILDEYINASRRDLVLTVCKGGREYPQIYTVNVIYIAYIPLYYILLFLYSDPS